MKQRYHPLLKKKRTFHLWKRVKRKVISVFFCSLFSIVCSSQPDTVNQLIQNISAEKNIDTRIDLINQLFMSTAEVNPVYDMQIAQLLLTQALKNSDRIGEALANSQIGYDYRALGNRTKSLEFFLKGVTVAENTGHLKLLGYTKLNLAHHYKDIGEFPKALGYYNTANNNALALNDRLLQLWALNSLGQVYLALNKLDSALNYAQRAYELRSLDSTFLATVLRHLGGIHGKLQNHELAISYFSLSLKEGARMKSPRWLNDTHTAMAEYYKDIGLPDSSIVYARKAIIDVENTAFSTKILKPAKLLLDIYENTNSDSAIKYFRIYRTANDSVFSTRSVQQTQLMHLEEELRQQELAAENVKKEKERKANTQYAAIAVAIIFLISIFLLLSRSIIVNEKWISFLGILGLLIIFEFINLLFHPYIASFTKNSPILMLIMLVGIAALLIPLHHKLEHWIKHKMVEKNKKLRLAAAKRTIKKLENDNL